MAAYRAESCMAMTLVNAAKQGDDLAFEGLLEPLLGPGYRLACAMLHTTKRRRMPFKRPPSRRGASSNSCGRVPRCGPGSWA